MGPVPPKGLNLKGAAMAIQTGEASQGPDPNSRLHDLLTTAMGVFAAILLATLNLNISEPAADYPFYKGPKLFPILALSVMALSALPSLFRLIRPPDRASWRLDGYGLPYKPAIVTLMLVVFFQFGLDLIGLEASVFLFMILSFWFLGYRRLGVGLLYPLIYTAIIMVLFKYVLDIWFAEPLVMELVGG